MYDYFQFMWEADIVLMGLGTQAVLCSITDSWTFQCGEKNKIKYNHIALLAKLICIAGQG